MIIDIFAIIGMVWTFFTVLAMITPTRHAKVKQGLAGFWEKLGYWADRIGLQFKSDKD